MTEVVSKSEAEDQPIVEDVPIKRDQLPQKDYYGKWDQFEKSTVADLEEEEKREKEESDRLLGKDRAFLSEDHKKDKTTHEALKEAKKLWDKRREEEIQAKHLIADLTGESVVVTTALLGGKKVVTLKNLTDCRVELPQELAGMIKLFVEGCVRTTVALGCKLVTSHVEASHCEGLELRVEREPLFTVQADLCKGVKLVYGPGLFGAETKVYSAGCLDLQVTAEVSGGGPSLCSKADYIADLAPLVPYTGGSPDTSNVPVVEVGKTTVKKAAAKPTGGEARGETGGRPGLVVGSVPAENGGASSAVGENGGALHSNAAQKSFSEPRSEEQHFITQLVGGKKLVTEVAIQVGSRWVTRRELDLESAQQAQVTARELLEQEHRAEQEKLSGNQAFGNAEYAQAAVHYTVAIDLALSGDAQSTQFPQPVSKLLHQCYSNRAACFLKLGHHDKALKDADSCVATAPEGYVKGHFRRGLALHALGRFNEALPSLGRALRLEDPKNKASVKQIEQAITFAERKLQLEMQRRMAR